MKNITFHKSFQPQNCPSEHPQMAATLVAGTQIYEMYEELDKHDAAIVGGANPVSIPPCQEVSILYEWYDP
jgi:hypothetical protein